MAPGELSRRVGQRRLEEPPVPDAPPEAEEPPASETPAAAPPPEAAVPPEGSAASLHRRRRAWLAERQRYDDATASSAPREAPPAAEEPSSPDG